MAEVLDLLKESNYQLGHCQILRYDSKRIDIFPPPYLSKLYFLMQKSSRRSSLGTLPETFCGMSTLDHDSVTAYLSAKPLLILAVWTSPSTFVPAGFAFPSVNIGIGDQKAIFGAYSYFMDWWGKLEILTLTLLGLGYFFKEFGQPSLLAIHGTRYATNGRSARLIKQVGFRDVGQVPRYMLRDGKLVDMIVSTLLVEDYEKAALPLLETIASEAERGKGIVE